MVYIISYFTPASNTILMCLTRHTVNKLENSCRHSCSRIAYHASVAGRLLTDSHQSLNRNLVMFCHDKCPYVKLFLANRQAGEADKRCNDYVNQMGLGSRLASKLSHATAITKHIKKAFSKLPWNIWARGLTITTFPQYCVVLGY